MSKTDRNALKKIKTPKQDYSLYPLYIKQTHTSYQMTITLLIG